MEGPRRRRSQIDDTLLAQVSALPRSGQRWLRTALLAVEDMQPAAEGATQDAPPAPRPAKRPKHQPALEELLDGKKDQREQTEAYPELADELEGLGDIVDLLREAGGERRRLGEEIRDQQLREQAGDEEPEDEEDEE